MNKRGQRTANIPILYTMSEAQFKALAIYHPLNLLIETIN